MSKKLFYLIGGNSNAILEFAKICLKKRNQVVIIRSKRNIHLKIPEQIMTRVKVYSTDKLERILNKNITFKKGDKIISFGSPWIISKDILLKANYQAYNCHNRDLPKYRGAGGYSWYILNNEKNSAICIHRLSSEIDRGEIIYKKKFTFPNNLQTPAQYISYEDKIFKKYVNNIYKAIVLGKKLSEQNEYKSTYYPRLNTSRQGWINWNWNGSHIEKFIKAFSKPYTGAQSFIKKSTIRIFKARFNFKKTKTHPFLNGLVFKNFPFPTVFCNNGYIEIIKYHGQKIKLGDRIFTPQKILDEGFEFRAKYKAT